MLILDCFRFGVHNSQLTITASDNENSMWTTLNLDECDGEGDFCVSSKNILNAMRELPEQPLSMNVNFDEMKIYIEYQNGNYDFPIQSAEEWPQRQALDDNAVTITIGAGVLLDCISRSLFATAQEELRPVMNGIYFDLTPDCLAIVASDGHKLVRNQNFSIKSETPASFILPKKPATLLKNVLSHDGADVVIRFDGRASEINYGDGALYCRLIEGRYPNYNSVIPKDNPNLLTVDRKILLAAVRRMLPFASDTSELIRFHIESGKLELSAEDIDFATSAKESIICDYSGSPMDIGFKGSSIVEVLSNLESDNVIIQLADPSRPGIIVPDEQPENENILMLAMPMLLEN
jgi:DNA polymerase-3 subunit beta